MGTAAVTKAEFIRRSSAVPELFMNKVGQNHGKSTMSKGLSCYTRSDSGSWSCLVEVIEVDTTRKQLKIHFVGFSHGYDEWRDYDNERNYFPFVRWKKMFFPAEGPLEDRGNIFHGRLYRCIKRNLWAICIWC